MFVLKLLNMHGLFLEKTMSARFVLIVGNSCVSPSDADRETMFGDCSHAKLKMTLIKQS